MFGFCLTLFIFLIFFFHWDGLLVGIYPETATIHIEIYFCYWMLKSGEWLFHFTCYVIGWAYITWNKCQCSWVAGVAVGVRELCQWIQACYHGNAPIIEHFYWKGHFLQTSPLLNVCALLPFKDTC